MKFIKSNWKEMLIVLLIALAANLYTKANNAMDAAIASQLKARAVAKEYAKAQAIVDKYATLNAAKDAEIKEHLQSIAILNASVTTWHNASTTAELQIAKLKSCPEKLGLSTSLLNECQGYVLQLKHDYTNELMQCDEVWRGKVALKDSELSEVYALDRQHIDRIGVITEQLILAKLKAKRRIAIGPYVGMGFDGKASAGIGIMVEVFRVKAPF